MQELGEEGQYTHRRPDERGRGLRSVFATLEGQANMTKTCVRDQPAMRTWQRPLFAAGQPGEWDHSLHSLPAEKADVAKASFCCCQG